MTTCNACNAVAPEAEENVAGYCYRCQGEVDPNAFIKCDWQNVDADARVAFPDLVAAHAEHEPGNMKNCDAFLCVCGNNPSGKGLYPCNHDGVEVEPTPTQWTEDLYACASCLAIIDGNSGKIIGKAKPTPNPTISGLPVANSTQPEMERTLVIIKPDAVAGNHIGNMLAAIEHVDLRIEYLEMLTLSRWQAEQLYAEHNKKPHFNRLVDFTIAGPLVVTIVRGVDAIERMRSLIGRAGERNQQTLRGLYGASLRRNGIHASDSAQAALREIQLLTTTSITTPMTLLSPEDLERYEDEGPPTVSLEKIAHHLRDAGFAARVSMSGGGCATLFAGPTPDDDVLAAGVGWFEGENYTQGVASLAEFYYGHADDASEGARSIQVTSGSEEAIAAQFIAFLKTGGR